MIAYIRPFAWALVTLVGAWLVAANLFTVGRLGLAAVGMLLLITALIRTVLAIIERVRPRERSPETQPLSVSASAS